MPEVQVSDYLCPAVAGTGITHSIHKDNVMGMICTWCGKTEQDLLLEVLQDGVLATGTVVLPPAF